MAPAARRRAVLFDVGGPLDREDAFERRIDAEILRALTEAGAPVDAAALASRSDEAVAAFAPNLYEAVVWSVLGPDAVRCRAVWSTVTGRMAADPPLVGGGGNDPIAHRASRALPLRVRAHTP